MGHGGSGGPGGSGGSGRSTGGSAGGPAGGGAAGGSGGGAAGGSGGAHGVDVPEHSREMRRLLQKQTDNIRALADTNLDLKSCVETHKMLPNRYKLYGVPVGEDMSDDDLNRLWKAAALKHHPDKNRDNVLAANERFDQAKQARTYFEEGAYQWDRVNEIQAALDANYHIHEAKSFAKTKVAEITLILAALVVEIDELVASERLVEELKQADKAHFDSSCEEGKRVLEEAYEQRTLREDAQEQLDDLNADYLLASEDLETSDRSLKNAITDANYYAGILAEERKKNKELSAVKQKVVVSRSIIKKNVHTYKVAYNKLLAKEKTIRKNRAKAVDEDTDDDAPASSKSEVKRSSNSKKKKVDRVDLTKDTTESDEDDIVPRSSRKSRRLPQASSSDDEDPSEGKGKKPKPSEGKGKGKGKDPEGDG